MTFYKKTLSDMRAYDPLNLQAKMTSKNFDFKKLKGRLVNTLYKGEDFWDLSEVIEVTDSSITLRGVHTPLFSTVSGTEKNLQLENFVAIEFLSVELELLSKKLGYKSYE